MTKIYYLYQIIAGQKYFLSTTVSEKIECSNDFFAYLSRNIDEPVLFSSAKSQLFMTKSSIINMFFEAYEGKRNLEFIFVVKEKI